MNRTLPELAADAMWRVVVDGLEEGVIVYDHEGRVLTGNPASERLLGLSASEQRDRTLTDPRWQIVGEDGTPLSYEDYPAYRALRSGRSEVALVGAGLPSGGRRWLQVKAQPISGAGELRYVVVSFSDVTEQHEAKAKLEREARFRSTLLRVVSESLAQGLDKRFYQRLLEGAAEAIPGVQAASLLLLAEGRYEFVAAVNYDMDALRRVYFLPEEMYRGDDAYNLVLVHGFDNSNVPKERREVIDDVGRIADIRVCMSIPVLLYGEPVAYISLDNFTSRDAFTAEALEMGRIFAQQTAALWQRFKLEADTQRLAFYDLLTGLPNRTLLYDRLRQAAARRGGKPLAVVFMDLDNFKYVNDTFGHDVGDRLLGEVAARLTGVVREGDTLARWGGDEFVLLTELERPEDAATVAEKLLGALEAPFSVGGRELRAQGSVGIDLLGEGRHDALEAVKHADIALYRAKAAGKGSYQFFSEDMKARLRRRLGLERDLREALRQEALTLHYQPRFELITGRVTGVEALARWLHPERGPVPPGEFISVAEEAGLTVPLGQQVLALATRQASAWRAAGWAVRVAVNVSAAQLAAADFVTRVEEALGRARLGGHALELEITESAAMQNVEDTVDKLRALRALGVRVALDDFGTAYSSLTYLKRLPLDVLKLDPSFVHDLSAADGRAQGLVRAMIEFGQSLGLAVVAEGVETSAQLELLRALGCREAQGYLLARPQSAAELELRSAALDVFAASR